MTITQYINNTKNYDNDNIVSVGRGCHRQPLPTPRGKSPGWPTGEPRVRKIRYPTVKKSTAKRKKEPAKSA